jgi:hypothetical protein
MSAQLWVVRAGEKAKYVSEVSERLLHRDLVRTHEGVNSPAALQPEAASQRGERRQDVKDLGKSCLLPPMSSVMEPPRVAVVAERRQH